MISNEFSYSRFVQYISNIIRNVGIAKIINLSQNDFQIFDIKNVDGGLIGGASLNAKDFIDIVNSIN